MANIKAELVHECSVCRNFRPLGSTPCHPRDPSGVTALCTCGLPMKPDGRAGNGKFLLLRCTLDGNRARLRR